MKQTRFDRQESFEVAGEARQYFDTPPYTQPINNGADKWSAWSIFRALTNFMNLPGTTATGTAGKDDVLYSIGTGTEVIARAAKGGVNLKTQATTPADNDNALLIPITSNGCIVPLTAAAKPKFWTRLSITTITEALFSAGLDEKCASGDTPTGQPDATAGDGAAFLFDPTGEVTTGLAVGTRTNWILTQKVAGADTFIDSGVPVIAGTDYDLLVAYGEDLIPHYYINGNLVGTGVAGTSGVSIGPVFGVKLVASSPSGQRDMDIRFALVDRQIG